MPDGLLNIVHDLGHGVGGEAGVGALQGSNHGVHPTQEAGYDGACVKVLCQQLSPGHHLVVVHEVGHVLGEVLRHLLVNTATVSTINIM